jgi:trans-aconitate methyltransferase
MGSSSTHWDPVAYSANSDIQFAITMRTLADCAFNGDERVLDVGCGDGRVSRQLSLRVPNGRVVGIDSSASMIRFAQANRASHTNLSFVLKDACALDFMNEFDVVVSTFCLQWLPDKAAAFRGIRNSLGRGGTAILIMPFRNPTIAGIRKQMAERPVGVGILLVTLIRPTTRKTGSTMNTRSEQNSRSTRIESVNRPEALAAPKALRTS